MTRQLAKPSGQIRNFLLGSHLCCLFLSLPVQRLLAHTRYRVVDASVVVGNSSAEYFVCAAAGIGVVVEK